MSVFGWLNDQLLRMTWLNDLVGAGVAAAMPWRPGLVY